MDLYSFIKTLHILSATVLFGTGIGIAFFMFRSYCTANLQEKAYATRNTVMADYCFTLPAVILQPVTGVWLIWRSGYDWSSLWLLVSYILYVVAGLCWLPVVWIQIRLKRIVEYAVRSQEPLSEEYGRLFKLWFVLGIPAFIALLVIFFLMVSKPL